MDSSVEPTCESVRCVRCNICVDTLRRYNVLDLDSSVSGIICSWLYPNIVMEDDFICEACRDLAIAEVNLGFQLEVSDSEEIGSNNRGVLHVCILCGFSTPHGDKLIARKQTETLKSMISIIKTRIEPREVTSSDRVCHVCWLQTKREVESMKQKSKILLRRITKKLVKRRSNLKEPAPAKKLVLPQYRRAANSPSTCVFPNCASTTLNNISDKLRATVLHKYNYYLPKLALICPEHLTNNSWYTLYNSRNSIKTFTADQVQHIFSFVNAFSPAPDFENVQDMDDRLFECCIGLSKEKFNVLLEQAPRISELDRGSLGLAAILLQLKTGDSAERMSKLVQVPINTLEGIMDGVREILCEEFAASYRIRNLPTDEIIRENRREVTAMLSHFVRTVRETEAQ